MKGIGASYELRLYPSLSTDTFIARRLGPTRNCVRDMVKVNEKKKKGVDGDGDGDNDAEAKEEKKKAKPTAAAAIDLPTPFYNQRVLEDMYLHQHHQQLVALIENSPAVRDAIVMLKVTTTAATPAAATVAIATTTIVVAEQQQHVCCVVVDMGQTSWCCLS